MKWTVDFTGSMVQGEGALWPAERDFYPSVLEIAIQDWLWKEFDLVEKHNSQ